MSFILALAILLPGINNVSAQKKTEEGYQPVILQFTIFHPLGTSGHNTKVLNYTSINLLYGKSAALQGFEVSGLAGRLTDYGIGFQVAGLGNGVENYFTGLQVAGFGNAVGSKLEGAQISGFGGVSGSTVYGAQISGFGSVAGSEVEGAQISGFGSITGGSLEGLQIAGFGNITGDKMKGFQLAGFGNITGGNMKGLQLAGFGNISGGSGDGAQIAGFMNANSSFSGFQLAPVNVNDSARGFQLGLVNISDKFEGVPIGLVSWVKNGYRKIDVWGNESFYMNAGFKSGVRNFYNILAFGYRPTAGHSRYGLGWGFGSEIDLGKSAFMSIEALAMQVGENELWTNKLNLLNQLKFNFGAELTPGLGIYGGPSLNVMVSEYRRADGRIGSGIKPSWTFYDETSGNTNVAIWAGFNVGLRIL